MIITFCFICGSTFAYFFQEVKKATPGVFKITVKNLSVYSREKNNWISVQKEPVEINIASKEEKVLNKFIAKIPSGRYEKIKYSVCATFKMKGYVNYNGDTFYTSKGSENGTVVTKDFNKKVPPKDYNVAPLTVVGYNIGEYFEPMKEKINFFVKENKIKDIRVEIDVKNSMALYQTRADPDVFQLMPSQPQVKIFRYK